MKTIDIDNVGPIDRLSIPIPDGGGLVVLRGGQGSGKTTALRAVSRTLGAGKAPGLSIRDGAQRGSLEFGDARLTVTMARATRRGELEVSELESRLDISALVDPGIEDQERADVARIKALIGLTGLQADPAAFYDLCGGREAFNELAIELDEDPVVLAGRVKRALEARAREGEKKADAKRAAAKLQRDAAAGVDMTGEHREEPLQGAYDAAIRAKHDLDSQRDQATRDRVRIQSAKSDLEKIQAEHHGPSLREAKGISDRCLDHESNIAERVRLLDAELAKVRTEHAAARARAEAAAEAERQAERFEDMVAAMRELVERPAVETPTEESLAEAADAVAEAKAAIERAWRIREAKAAIERADDAAAQAKNLTREAERLRDAARAIDDVLSAAIPSGVLRVQGGRLVTQTDRSPAEPFAELSSGERWKLAIDLACEQLPPAGVLCIPQEAYEGLQPANQRLIHEHAKLRKVAILTAEATDGELSATEFAANGKKQ